MDRGAWQATAHGVTKSQKRLSEANTTLLHTGLPCWPLFNTKYSELLSGWHATPPCRCVLGGKLCVCRCKHTHTFNVYITGSITFDSKDGWRLFLPHESFWIVLFLKHLFHLQFIEWSCVRYCGSGDRCFYKDRTQTDGKFSISTIVEKGPLRGCVESGAWWVVAAGRALSQRREPLRAPSSCPGICVWGCRPNPVPRLAGSGWGVGLGWAQAGGPWDHGTGASSGFQRLWVLVHVLYVSFLSPCPVFPLDLCSWPVLMARPLVASSMGTSAYHGGPSCGGGSWGSTVSLCLVDLGEHNGSGRVLEPRHLFPAPSPVPPGKAMAHLLGGHLRKASLRLSLPLTLA